MQLNVPVEQNILARKYAGYRFVLIQSKTLIQSPKGEKVVVTDYYITRDGEIVWDNDRTIYTLAAAKYDFFHLIPTLLPPASTNDTEHQESR